MSLQTETEEIWIYGLVDPRDPGKVRYVGQTLRPRHRHLQHCQELSTTAKGEWIESLRQCGVFPQMVILESVTGRKAAFDAEHRWIEKHRPDLTNTQTMRLRARQGQGKPIPSQRTRAAALLGAIGGRTRGKCKARGAQKRLWWNSDAGKAYRERLAQRAKERATIAARMPQPSLV